MIIWIILITLFTLALVSYVTLKVIDRNGVWVYKKSRYAPYHKYWQKETPYISDTIIEILGIILVVVYAIIYLILILTIYWQAMPKYDLLKEYRADLVKSLESVEGDNKNILYNDVLDYNTQVRELKYYHNNPWTSWFINDKANNLELINIG